MGWRAPAGTARVGADRQRYEVCCHSRCRAARRTTGCQFRIERMPCWPEQQRRRHALAGKFGRGAHAHNNGSRLLQSLDGNGIARRDKVGKKPGSLRHSPAIDPDVVLDHNGDAGKRHAFTELQATIYGGGFRKRPLGVHGHDGVEGFGGSHTIQCSADDFDGRGTPA